MSMEQSIRLSSLPKIKIPRSKFNTKKTHKATFNFGELVPIAVKEVLPGDTMNVSVAQLVRMSTPIFPVMDNAYLDIRAFYCPTRLVWEHFKEFLGENNTTYWEQPTKYLIPQITAPAGGWAEGTLADHMELPTKIANLSVSALPFRVYTRIWNDWFRDENLKQPCQSPITDGATTGSNGTNYITDCYKGGMPAKAAKFHDLFTSCLPSPQKGPDVLLPLGGTSGLIPVVAGADHNYVSSNINFKTDIPEGKSRIAKFVHPKDYSTQLRLDAGEIPDAVGNNALPTNLYADVSKTKNSQYNTTINQLREALDIQRFYETQARYGTRYTEFLQGHFGVTAPDASLQRTQYLGGTRIPINMQQVVQTSAATTESPLGNVGAVSATGSNDELFTTSFTEHGYIMILACARTEHTYQQGINRMWLQKDVFDFYVPELARLGEQPVRNEEIYAQGNAQDKEVFGYQEAWYQYRYDQNAVTGKFRGNADGTLRAWTYSDYYGAKPTLSSTWIDETDINVKETIAVQNQPQLIGDFLFTWNMVRPIPMYSIPSILPFM